MFARSEPNSKFTNLKDLRYHGGLMPVAEKHQGDGNRPAPAGWRGRAAALGAPALLLLVVILFYWKITLSNQYTWLESPDFAYQVLPWYQFQAGEWHQHKFPLWDPYLWGGQPLLGQGLAGAAYPPNWILFAFPLRNGWIRESVLHWYYVLTHFLAALFCYWLCRDLGRSRGAALLAGLGFSLCGWMAATDWPQMLNGALWTPLVFLFLLRTLRGRQPLESAALAGACLGLAFLSGHHQIPVFVGLAAGGLWIYGLFREGRFQRALVAPAAAFVLFLFLLSAFQTLPAYEYGNLAVRWVGSRDPVGWHQPVPYSVHTEFSLYPLSLLGIVINGFWRHANPFIGVVLAGLAFAGLAAAWREWHVRVMAAVALGGLVYALARHTTFEGIVYALVPFVEKARNPSMAIFIFHFGIAVLSAYAIDFYLTDEKWSGRLRTGLLWFAGALFALLLGASLTVTAHPVDYDMVALAAFTALLLAGVLYGWRRGHMASRTATTLLVLLLIMEAGGTGSSFYWHHREDSNLLLNKLSQHQDIVDFLRRQDLPVRVEYDEQEIPYNLGDWYGIDTFGGYLASMTANVIRVQSNYRARMLFATNFYIGRKPSRANQPELFASSSGLKVYANPEAFPRAWSVHETVRLAGPQEIGLHLDQDSIPLLRRRAFLAGEQPPLAACSAPDRVWMAERSTNRVVITAEMACRGLVVAAEPYFPGWQATVDGRPVRIRETYGCLRGVVVDAGRHRIEMRYRPRSVLWGGILTLSGLFGALAILGLGIRRRPVL